MTDELEPISSSLLGPQNKKKNFLRSRSSRSYVFNLKPSRSDLTPPLLVLPAPKARTRRRTKKRVGSVEVTTEEEEEDEQRQAAVYPMDDNDNFDMTDVQPMDDEQGPGYVDYSIRTLDFAFPRARGCALIA